MLFSERLVTVCATGILLFAVSCSSGSTKGTGPSLYGDAVDVSGEIGTDADGSEDQFVVPDQGSSDLPLDFAGLDTIDPCELDPGSLACPCQGNADCHSGYCVPATGGSVCTMECLEECPLDWTCTGIMGFGADIVFLCIPEQGALCGSGQDAGLLKSCSATWPADPEPGESFIACYGFQECVAGSWSGCDLPPETCDSLDNNCDGMVDEGFVDESGRYFTVEHCGQCNNNCTFLDFDNAEAICDGNLKVPECAMGCLPGFHDLNHNPEDGCECQFISETDYPDGTDQNCDGADGEIGQALFVAKNGDDSNSGAIDQPMRNIQNALEKAVEEGKRDVYVASGVYATSIQLLEGVGLYGGYSSDFQKRDVDLNVTVIMGDEFSVDMPGAVNAAGISGDPGTTVLDGFTVFGHNNTTAGGSTYGVYVRDCSAGLLLANNTVESGAAGAGAKGADGTNGSEGQPGAGGEGAFGVSTSNCGAVDPQLPRAGGSGGDAMCGEGAVAGGSGGGNTCPDQYGAAPANYENGQPGAGDEGGAAGTGGYDREIWYCPLFPPKGECHQAGNGNETGTPGGSGGDGADGETVGGNGCLEALSEAAVLDGLWVGALGQSGQSGSDGSGGGGGGAGGGAQNASSCSATTHVGGGGGGGGSGGCSGSGGEPGGFGGGSFGLFMIWDVEPESAPTVVDNVFVGGVGGAGGQGGNAGSGGPGGAGGLGGADDFANAQCAAPGGIGGDGGDGGHGEGGGGGCGGPSFCLFQHGADALNLGLYKSENAFVLGVGGAGGSGGPSIGYPGDMGTDGAAVSTNL